jgi:lipoprotein-anchoring transpeptidase ErfK/SrfK
MCHRRPFRVVLTLAAAAIALTAVPAHARDDRPLPRWSEPSATQPTLDRPPESPANAASATWGRPPFAAWVGTDVLYVRKEAKIPSPLIGSLRQGDTVTVSGCVPECGSTKAWALLAPDDGAVKLALLRPMPVPPDAFATSANVRYVYGKVVSRVPVYAQPNTKKKPIRKEQGDFRLAFVPDESLYMQGWLRRPDGGYMRAKDVKLFKVSNFQGQFDPPEQIAFVRRKVKLKGLPKGTEPPVLQRYDRFQPKAVKGGKVYVDGGWIPRDLVRIATKRRPPREVKPADKWLHVDIGQQVLTAYEGDRMVFATLISSGKLDRRSTKTPDGTFRMYAKTVHSSMRGKPWDDYYAEEVPYVMHFTEGKALHGTYWHDQFGIVKSHGCVNLSLHDAKWVFDWMPPKVPDGWHATLTMTSKLVGTGTVIQIDKPGRGKQKSKANLAQR